MDSWSRSLGRFRMQARIPEGTKGVGTMAWRKRVPLIRAGVVTTVMSLTVCSDGGTEEEPATTNPAAPTLGNALAGEPAGGEHTR
jgi:hypothetical protein